MDQPTVIDLFAGAGGLSEGFRQAGFRVLAGSDSDPDAVATFAENFPAAEAVTGDVRAADVRERLHALAREADVVVGGPPCQGFSQVRNHARLIDEPDDASAVTAAQALSDLVGLEPGRREDGAPWSAEHVDPFRETEKPSQGLLDLINSDASPTARGSASKPEIARRIASASAGSEIPAAVVGALGAVRQYAGL